MKKIMSTAIVLILAFVFMGCEEDNPTAVISESSSDSEIEKSDGEEILSSSSVKYSLDSTNQSSSSETIDEVISIDSIISGSFIDSRDQEQYSWTKIGSQTWMAENLRFRDSTITEWICFENESENCDLYGASYTFFDAQNVCPEDWHLSTNHDWETLIQNVSTLVADSVEFSEGNTSQHWTYVGHLLKEHRLWDELYNYDPYPEENKLGFNALPVGYEKREIGFPGYYWDFGGEAIWWSNEHMYWSILIGGTVIKNTTNATHLYVRCVKNIEEK